MSGMVRSIYTAARSPVPRRASERGLRTRGRLWRTSTARISPVMAVAPSREGRATGSNARPKPRLVLHHASAVRADPQEWRRRQGQGDVSTAITCGRAFEIWTRSSSPASAEPLDVPHRPLQLVDEPGLVRGIAPERGHQRAVIPERSSRPALKRDQRSGTSARRSARIRRALSSLSEAETQQRRADPPSRGAPDTPPCAHATAAWGSQPSRSSLARCRPRAGRSAWRRSPSPSGRA